MSKDLRTLFMGIPGQFSRIVLERLLACDNNPVAVFLSGQKSVPLRSLQLPNAGSSQHPGEELELPLLNSPSGSIRHGEGLPASLPGLAMQSGIPVFECGKIGHTEVTDWLAGMSLDVVCVACWNRLIPPHVLDIPQYGFLNVHPSILPAYRGPYPLFWQYRAGEEAMGVTVHWMDAGLDTGDIAGQREIQLEDGLRGPEAEAPCAMAGGDLLAEVLANLARGASLRWPQPEGGSYFPAPSRDDFALDASWHPRRAFNFMRANAEWGIPFRLDTEGGAHWLNDALEWREEGLPGPVSEGRMWASFRGGWVLAEEFRGAGQ